MEKLRVAVATDDGESFVTRHFGDTAFYDVYDLSPDGAVFVVRVANRTGQEQGHADPKKARGITELLREQGVQVALARFFGPNIRRLQSKFVCVLTGDEEIARGLESARLYLDTIEAAFEKGEQRDFLDLRRA